ncbi:uncharacterized protein LOC134232686 [Saccostrea cucullata]|uniref:uncharacterized protein LOC134232686 n=1 Tax=Saccostrea cuccullata TaxID=36930 RepID=UPI002ED15283
MQLGKGFCIKFYIFSSIGCLLLSKICAGLNKTDCSVVEMVKKVETCPSNKSKWLLESERKQCSTSNDECEKVYHCMTNAYKNETFDFCATNVILHGHYCGEFNEGGGIVQENYNNSCQNFNHPCPFLHNSSEEYKYPNCSETDKGTAKTPNTDIESRVTPYLAFVLILVIALPVGGACQFYKKRKEENKGLKTYEEVQQSDLDNKI